jgi:uncharacterized membrane protein
MRTHPRLRPVLILLVALWPAVVAGQAPSGPDEGVEEVEEVEVKPLEATKAAGPGAEPRGAADLAGRLHPLLVHFPIAWLLLLLLLDLVTFGLRRRSWERAGRWLLLLTALSFAAAIVTGLLRAAGMPIEGPVVERLSQHRTAALVAGGLCLAAAALRGLALARGWTLAGPLKAIYLLLVVLAALGVMVGGHLGGKMVYGEEYLPF